MASKARRGAAVDEKQDKKAKAPKFKFLVLTDKAIIGDKMFRSHMEDDERTVELTQDEADKHMAADVRLSKIED